MSNLPLAIVSHALPNDWLAMLKDRCQLLIGPAELEAHLSEAEGLFTLLTLRVDEVLLSRAQRLRVVSNMAVGVDNVDVAACTRRGIPVGNTPGVLTEATADLTMALLLSAARRLPEASADAREGRWATWTPTAWLGADLNGATLGIVGLGRIGLAVATRAKAFGMQIVYANRNANQEAEQTLRASRLSLDDLLRQSDFVSLHLPLSSETRRLIDERALRLMKPTAILVNAARGGVVNMTALHRALSEGWIAGAALDVTDPEPLPADHPLYRLPNCLITPHIGSATRGARKRMAELACENLLAGLEGKPMPHCVNREVYNR
ncbi:MAG: D-glycerate dehydrogenase [Chloroflexi bacterium]|nr:D-glycerate dehydrogenase [Chloroflexota bacterium]